MALIWHTHFARSIQRCLSSYFYLNLVPKGATSTRWTSNISFRPLRFKRSLKPHRCISALALILGYEFRLLHIRILTRAGIITKILRRNQQKGEIESCMTMTMRFLYTFCIVLWRGLADSICQNLLSEALQKRFYGALCFWKYEKLGTDKCKISIMWGSTQTAKIK